MGARVTRRLPALLALAAAIAACATATAIADRHNHSPNQTRSPSQTHNPNQTHSPDHAVPVAPGITVQGSQLLRDGVPWMPRGVQIVGPVAPDGALSGKYVPAHARFGQGELQAALAAGADVVRFQVSEFGLDPQGPLYSSAYVQEVWNAVHLARGLGLDVIVSLQAEPPAGEATRCPLPDAGAQRAWGVLAPMFTGDSGVMFELYNEPAIAASAPNWQEWRDGGALTTDAASCQAVGMQTLIDDIRSYGAGNVIILPGLAGEQTLAGMPRPADPEDPSDPQLAYGIHYPSLTRGSPSWDQAFGRASAHLPVLVTEWDANSTTNCLPSAPAESTLLLDYLASKRIGLVGFAFDLPGTIVADDSYAPTSYAGFTCGVANGGPGQLLFGDYSAEANAEAQAQALAPAQNQDQGTRGVAPAWIVRAATLARLAALSPATIPHIFDTPRTFVVGASSARLASLSAPTAVPTESFANESTLAAVAGGGRLRPGTRAVVYAPGASSATPRAQQRDPGPYFHRAAQIAHARGLLLIAEPAVSLAQASDPHVRPSQVDKRFLSLRIPAAAARYADVYQTDAQAGELRPGQFASFVTAASDQAAGAHPGIELLGELTTNAGTPPLSAGKLLDAVSRTGSAVSGYLLNVAQVGGRREIARSNALALTFLRRFDSLTG